MTEITLQMRTPGTEHWRTDSVRQSSNEAIHFVNSFHREDLDSQDFRVCRDDKQVAYKMHDESDWTVIE